MSTVSPTVHQSTVTLPSSGREVRVLVRFGAPNRPEAVPFGVDAVLSFTNGDLDDACAVGEAGPAPGPRGRGSAARERTVMPAATILSGTVDGHGTGEVVTFASLASLARRAGGVGGSWTVEHEPAFDPARRTVMLLRSDRHGTHVVARVWVDSEAITSS